MLLTGIATVGAFILLGLGATRQNKGALFMTAGVLMFIVATAMHVASWSGFLQSTAAISAEVGIGCVLLAGMLRRHDRDGKPFFVLGSLSLTSAVLLLIGLKFAAPATTYTVNESQAESWLLELGPDDDISEVAGMLDSHGASWERAFPSVTLEMDEHLAQVYLLRVPSGASRSLARSLRADIENVDHLGVNFEVSLIEPFVGESASLTADGVRVNDPLASQQWALDAINGYAVHDMLADVQPVKKALVAILDTGVDASHEDVSSSFADSPGSVDLHGHGSHCAGIAGATTNNGKGIASLNLDGRFIQVAGYKALNDQGFGDVEMIAQAIVDATNDGADVISMSLGAKAETPKTVRDAIQYARRNHVVVLASAGNSNEDAIDHMPSNVDGVIVVSAVDENLNKAKFSNTNTSLARPIAAPGVNILSLKNGGGYVSLSGTSMSTPVVSGIVGMMRSLNPDLTDDEVWSILNRTSVDVKDSRRIGRFVDAEAAILEAMGGA